MCALHKKSIQSAWSLRGPSSKAEKSTTIPKEEDW